MNDAADARVVGDAAPALASNAMPLPRRISVRLAARLMPILGLVLLSLGGFAVWQEAEIIEADQARDARVLAEGLAYTLSTSGASSAQAAAWIDGLGSRVPEVRVAFVPHAEPAPAHLTDPRGSSGRRVATGVAQVDIDGSPVGWVRVEASLTARDAFVRRALVGEAVTVLVLFLVATWAAAQVGEVMIGRRIDTLRRYLREVGAGGFPDLPGDLGTDEVGELAASAEAMSRALRAAHDATRSAEEARARAQLLARRSDRLAAVGRTAAVFAHEIGTPLAVILGRARKLGGAADPDVARAARIVVEQAERVEGFTERLLAYARHDDAFVFSPVDLASVARCSMDLVESRARARDVRIVGAIDDVRVMGDRRALEQVCVNLLTNAIDAAPVGSDVRVVVRAEPCEEDPGALGARHVHLDVIDAGRGVPAHLQERVFEPFFTTKPPGEGTGLGLPIVREIVEDHGGRVTFPEHRTGFAIRAHLRAMDSA